MKENIQVSAEYLANLCLENDKYSNYTDKDLLNATLIFSHILIDKIWSENKDLPQEKKEELGETTGKAIREIIKVSCGKDMHEVTKAL